MDTVSFLRQDFFAHFGSAAPSAPLHIVLIATKPDIIKQVPLYRELQKRGHRVILGHTGQHYDANLSGGMLAEFGVEPDFNLNVRGAMHEVVGQIIARFGWIIAELKKHGNIVIPYVHGDTTTAMAASNAGYCNESPAVHVEAGIRTLTPDYAGWMKKTKSTAKDMGTWDIGAWRSFCMERSNWLRGSQEPYPEQFNTRCSEAGTGIHFAPVELDREFLLSEGFSSDRIFVVGNSVADALKDAESRVGNTDIFEKFPVLKDGDFVRFCVHRRENCISAARFVPIFRAAEHLLQSGRKILWISLFQTEAAIDRFDLRSELDALKKRFASSFIYSPVWPKYTDVVAAMMRCSVCATDSGSMQEEMNVLGVPCVTLRFGSDRSESAMVGGNIIAPPVDAGLIANAITFAWNNKQMQQASKLYGENVSVKCVDVIEKVLAKGNIFRGDNERLGL